MSKEQEDMFIVCRETDPKTGDVIVYDVGFVDKDKIRIQLLQLRSTYNINLKYYAMLESKLDLKDYIIGLIKKEVSSILYTYV